MSALVTVTVPDGIGEGQEFVVDYEGQQLMVCCPSGCGPGSDINIEVPTGGGMAPPELVDVAVPDGCLPGMEFTVDFAGTSFNITVPDGVHAGEMLTVEVPAHADGAPPPPAEPPAPPTKSPVQRPPKMELNEIPPFRGATDGVASKREKPSASKYLTGLDIPPFRGPMKGVTANSVNAHAKWTEGARSLFDMGPDMGYGRAAGDFAIGQLVQVLRSNGSWTYAKMMDYDPSGDTCGATRTYSKRTCPLAATRDFCCRMHSSSSPTEVVCASEVVPASCGSDVGAPCALRYSVMTKVGPKHFVERDDITVEILSNPSGGWARE